MAEIELGARRIQLQKEPTMSVTASPKKEKKEPKNAKFKFEVPTIKYSDVIGMRRPKALLHKLLELPLRKPQEFMDLKINKSIGIILYGPPGTGKTLITKAVCGELQIKMCYVAIGSVMSKYVGESSKNVQEVFKLAKKNQPDAIFIDEADVLLQSRDEISNEGGSTELKQAVSQMLQETSLVHDDKASHIYMLASTNAPWSIDQAHRRSGRFEYLIYIPAPTIWERRKLIRHYLRANDPLTQAKFGNINYTLLALATSWYSPADVEKIVKIAKINAIERKKVLITTRSLQKALWSKEGGKSSLDAWYMNMAVKYLPQRRSFWKSLASKKYRNAEEKKVKFDRADLELYKEMVGDIKHYMRHRIMMRMVRLFGRGMPIITT